MILPRPDCSSHHMVALLQVQQACQTVSSFHAHTFTFATLLRCLQGCERTLWQAYTRPAVVLHCLHQTSCPICYLTP